MSESSALSGPAVLFQAVRSGNLIEVKRLIEVQGVAVSSEGPLDETDDVCLMHAFFASSRDIICVDRRFGSSFGLLA